MVAKVCILLVLMAPLVLLQCPPTLYDNSIIADTMTLSSMMSAQSQYTYTFQQRFQQLPQITIGIIQFSINTNNPSKPSFFWMNVTGSQMGIQVGVQLGASSWSIKRITIMASSNGNLLLDLLSGTFSNLASQSYQGNLEFKLNSKNYLPQNQSLITRTFLAGINSSSALSFLSLANSSLLGNQLNLSILSISNSTISIKILVALIAFPAQINNFSVYGGLTSASTPGIHASDLFQSLSATQNIFYGVNALSLSSTALQTSFNATIDKNFILSLIIQGSSSSFQLSYLFLGNPPQTVCSACVQNGEGSIYSQEGCVASCPAQSVLVTVGQGQTCRPCPSALNIGYQNGYCVECGAGTIAMEGVCVPSVQLPASPPGISSTLFSSSGIGYSTNMGVANQYTSPSTGQKSITPSSQPTIMSPSITSTTLTQTISSSITNPSSNPLQTVSSSQQCPIPNMFWNGNQCICIVGYVMVVNVCIQIQLPSISVIMLPYPQVQTTNTTECLAQNQYFNGQTCTCKTGYYSINGVCTSCPLNSIWNGQQCICNKGHILFNGICYQSSIPNDTTPITVVCPIYSFNNGLGVCICQQDNYQLVNGSCQPPNCLPTMRWNGTQCVCDQNHPVMNSNGSCSPRCPSGQLWNNLTCIVVCSLNMQYNAQQRQCVCIPGFAIGQGGQCQQCQTNYYILNGYCVTCPINSFFSSPTNICTCKNGYIQNRDGTCSPKCSTLQEYNPTAGTCNCLAGLGTIGGVCKACPSTSYLQNGICVNCAPNSTFSSSNGCVCNTGYLLSPISQTCLPCSSFPNSFLINGLCAVCPNNKKYNPLIASCSCPSGTVPSGNSCVQACQSDQLLDANGNCYSCRNNMVISGGQCVCKPGFAPMPTGCGCQLNCSSNQFQFMGACGHCPLNMLYMPNLQGCVCPPGYYLDAIFKVCEPSPALPTTNCTLGQYFNFSSAQCLSCPQYCTSCSSVSCSQCLTGYQPTANACQTVCGDGIVAGTENCDTGAVPQGGCINCKIISGYTCTGQPSVCTLIPPPSTPNNSDSLKLKGNININSNNIFLTLTTNPTFSFPDNQTMRTFIQAQFKNTIAPTMYCQQQISPNFNLFDCLLIYPNGVPNNNFNITFSYNFQSHSASLNLLVTPINLLKTRIKY